MEVFSENKHRYSAVALTTGIHSVLFLVLVFTILHDQPGTQSSLAFAGEPGITYEIDFPVEGESTANPELPAKNTEPVLDQHSEHNISISSGKETPSSDPGFAEAISRLKRLKNNGSASALSQSGIDNTSGAETSVGLITGLSGRTLEKAPKNLSDPKEEGVVVVEIIVDENGDVIRAVPGQRGSTTQSARLYSIAREAAREAKFSPGKEGIKEQRSLYTFVFSLE